MDYNQLQKNHMAIIINKLKNKTKIRLSMF